MASLSDALRRAPPLETAILAVALALLVALSLYRSLATPVALPASFSSYDAAGGGYRAFYELLRAEGVQTDRFEQHPAFLDAGIDTLVWAEPSPLDPRAQAPARADVMALTNWIRSGGRLVYLIDGNANAAFVAAARAQIAPLELPRVTSAQLPAHRRSIARSLAGAGVAHWDEPQALHWRVARRRVTVLVDDGRGATIVTYELGRGAVTAALDETALTNAGIARGDNARLAVALTMPRRRGAFVSFDEAPHGFIASAHWWQIVPRLLLLALALAALAIVIALAGAGVRLGPPLLTPASDVEPPPDLIDGLAALLERGRAYAHALAAAHASAFRALPCDQAELKTAGAACDERSFIRGVARAQQLRKDAVDGSARH